MKKNLLLPIFLFVLCSQTTQALVYLKSEPGDPILNGQVLTIASDPQQFPFGPSAVGFIIDFDAFLVASFTTPIGEPIAVGRHDNVIMSPPPLPPNTAPDHSTMFVGSLFSPACSTGTGWFDIREYSETSIAIDFQQQCTGATGGLVGSIRINSDLPIPFLENIDIELTNPINIEGCVEATSGEGATLELLANIVSDDGSDAFDIQWQVSNGTSGTGETLLLDVPLNETLVVDVLATNVHSNSMLSDSLSVCVSDTIAPSLTILSPTEGETFVGNNATVEVQVSDIVDTSISSYHISVAEEFIGALSGGYGKTRLFKSSEKYSIDKIIVVTAQDASGNVGQAQVNVTALHDNRN